MKYVVAFGRFWYNLIIGDDWTVAVGVVLALVLTARWAHDRLAWLWLPLAVGVLLTVSVWRAAKPSDSRT